MSGATNIRRQSRLQEIQSRLRQQIHSEHQHKLSALQERQRILELEKKQVNVQRTAIEALRKRSVQSRENSINSAAFSRSRSASEKLLKPNIRYKAGRIAPLTHERKSAPLSDRSKQTINDERSYSAGPGNNIQKDKLSSKPQQSHPLATMSKVEPLNSSSHKGNSTSEVANSAEDAFSQFEAIAEAERQRALEQAEKEARERDHQRAIEAKKRKQQLEELKNRQEERQRRMKERSRAHTEERAKSKQAVEAADNQTRHQAAKANFTSKNDNDATATREARNERKENSKSDRKSNSKDKIDLAEHLPHPPATERPIHAHTKLCHHQNDKHEAQEIQQKQNYVASDSSDPNVLHNHIDKHDTQTVEEIMPDGSISVVELVLHPCPICGRKFRQDRLNAHKRICATNSKKKRKQFDMTKQRLNDLGSEAIALAKRADKTDAKYKKKLQKGNWRAKHQQFQAAIKSARGVDVEVPVDPSLVKCKFCDRTFNEDAAKRHIPVCEKNFKKKAMAQGQRSRSKATRANGR